MSDTRTPAVPTKPAPNTGNRAEIFTPEDGNYRFGGHGGEQGGKDRPPNRPQPAPVKAADAEVVPVARTRKRAVAVPKPAPKNICAPCASVEAKPPISKPAPKPIRRPANPADPVEQSRVLAETMVDSFVGRLKQEAQKKGGKLSVEDLDNMSEEFQAKTEVLQKAFQKSFEQNIEAHVRNSFYAMRGRPYERLVVKTFSNIIDDRGPKLKAGTHLSRRMLPGLFLVLKKMLGEDKINEFEQQASQLVERLKMERADEFNWEHVYAHDESRRIMVATQILVALHFRDLQRRAGWFIEMINSNLGAMEPDMDRAAESWTFGEPQFNLFVKTFFTEMNKFIATDGGKLWVTKHYGVDTIVTVADVVQELEQVGK